MIGTALFVAAFGSINCNAGSIPAGDTMEESEILLACPLPTRHEPGTEGKVEILAARYDAGLELFDAADARPGDARDDQPPLTEHQKWIEELAIELSRDIAKEAATIGRRIKKAARKAAGTDKTNTGFVIVNELQIHEEFQRPTYGRIIHGEGDA